jgi:Dolichyl-phosphate-mannose-protein mannosyltransferase
VIGSSPDRRFVVWLLAIATIALALRLVFPAADPPWETTVGIVWHDEGAWVHNARNRALFGAWTQDAWNPMFIAPVFTVLEYWSFALFGVGIRQARLVSELAGFSSVILLAFGVRRLAGREAGLIAGSLVATNYVYVMWNRAALMEATMVAFIVAAWYCYVRAQDRAWWGALAAACALLAYFSKAAAVFFVAALGLEAALALVRPSTADGPASRAAARATLIGLAGVWLIALVFFLAPNWTEYRFYNWQISVTRKPTYDLHSLLNRVTWFPIIHDIFTRMWFVVVLGLAACLGAIGRWRSLPPGERLLVFWVGLGALELVLHDVGNERRFVFFIPALVALAAIVLGRNRTLAPPELGDIPVRRALLALPLVLFGTYVVMGALARLAFIYETRPGVWLGATLSLLSCLILYATWPRIPRWLARNPWSSRAAFALAILVSAGDVAQFLQWASGRTYKNYDASVEIGKRLPPGTLVHGKLANGLSLENQIRPVFVGTGFGNYEDRKRREDVRYILTYVAPRAKTRSGFGYEGPVIEDVLDAYPHRTIVLTFEVAETTTGHDRAALIDKFGGAPAGTAGRTWRAYD